MSTEKIPVTKRLVSRMILVGILPTVILLGAIIALNARRGYRAAIDELEANLRAEVALAAAEIEDGNNNAVLTAQRMAEAQMAGMFGDRAASLAYARAVLAASPALTAAYVCYEPDADGADTASLAEENDLPAAAMDATGRFIPYWFIDPSKGGSIELEPAVDMDTSLYYQGVKKEFARDGKPTAMVTEPYEYEGKMIVEQTFPIVIDGAFKGVAGVDRALTDLERDLVRLASRMEANAALISGRGKFIAVSIDGSDVGEELQTQATSDTAFASLVATLRADPRDVFVTTGDGPLTGEPHYFAVAGIPTGDWMLVMGRSRSDVLAPITTQLVRSLILAVVGLLIITVILLGGAIYVTRRINLGVDAATRVARGDLTGDQSPSAGGDETAALLRALGAMTTNLNGLVGQVKQSSIQLNSTATEVAATSREQDATAKSFGAATSQIAAAAKQISATSGELARTIEDVDHVASGTAGLASAGRTDLDTMQSTMHGLDDATRSIADKLAVINEKASRITGVVTTINKVAEQTNLLSVNAAIEAEKAGEYGQGFLVVAREIRRLADQTGAATLDIEQMVQQMQSSVSTGVMEMDRFADQVRHVVASVGQISSQMGEILENVNSNSASFKQVNEGMRSQSLGAQQISEAMGQLTTDAQHTSAAVREYGQAAEQLHDAVAKLRSSISSFRLRSE